MKYLYSGWLGGLDVTFLSAPIEGMKIGHNSKIYTVIRICQP